jgi:hypothetical protein
MHAIKLISWLSFLAVCLIVLPGGVRSTGAPIIVSPKPASSLERALDVTLIEPTYLTLSEANAPTYGGSITIEAWVKPDKELGCGSIYGHNLMYGIWLGRCSPGNGVRFSRFGRLSGDFVDGTIPVTGGEWRHIAAVYNEATAQSSLFVDGVQDGEPQAQVMPPGWALPPGNAYIGNDPYGFQFVGLIDEVRVWNVARTAEQIRADMYLEFIAPRPGLIAEWPMQGNGNDAAGAHHGTTSYPNFSVDSPLPIQTTAPYASSRLALDGACDPQLEYAGAPLVSMGTAQVYPVKTATDLWLCVRDLSGGPVDASNYRVSIYLDPGHIHGTAPEASQRRFSLFQDGQRTSAFGNGSRFTPLEGLNRLWDAAYEPAVAGSASAGSMEFRISSRMLFGWDHTIGLALREEWEVAGVEAGDAPAWPFYAAGSAPDTWGDLTLLPVLIDLPLVMR